MGNSMGQMTFAKALGDETKVPGHEKKMKIGKKNLINNFCIGISGNQPSCTKCHAGYGWEDDSYDFESETNYMFTKLSPYFVSKGRPKRYYHVSIALTAGLGVLNLVVVNLRWVDWVEFVGSDATAADGWMSPLWALNLLLIGIFAMVLTALVFKVRHLHGRD